MSNDEALRRLADSLGIETSHTDALGVRHEVSDETLSALVGAFGLPAAPRRAVRAVEAWRHSAPLGLDPVQILHAEAPRPELRLGRAAGAPAISWVCRLEDGRELSGRAEADDAARRAVPLPAELPLGYHRLELRSGSTAAEITLIVAPPACHLPAGLMPGARSWGLTCQLYGMRSRHDWGMGDFTALGELCRVAGSIGAAAIGVNPLHALFAAEPRHVSPYSPSSRSHLDYLYIDATAAPGFAEDEAVRDLVAPDRLAAARTARLVDHGAVAALKRPVLEALFQRLRSRDLDAQGGPRSALGQAFREFQQAGGQGLASFAAFEALHEHFNHDRRLFSWRSWPAPLRDPNSAETAEFARSHRDRIEFFEFLQWEADRQLAAAAASGRASGLSIGLYRDLAVGADPHGAEAWGDQALVMPGAAIGAPPDQLSRAGQNWGLAPINPVVLRRYGFAPFIALLRANMKHAGVLRIDHVMSLRRLYWIPNGSAATAGAYVAYPFGDLLRLVALESHRQRCAVIGEDLGTVPEGFRETMQRANVLSYRVVAFERRADRGFVPPAEYPALAAASAATHDIATVKGFWLGRDLSWRRRLGLYPDAASDTAESAERTDDRRLLLEALAREGLLAAERFHEFLPETGEPRYGPELGDAILGFLARSRSRLMLVQLEDVAGESEQANLPGTTDAHPNWRRRMSRPLEEIFAGAELRRITRVVETSRQFSAAQ